MKYTIFLLIFFIPVLADSQPFVQWQRCYGGTHNEEPGDIIETRDGGYIMTGQTHSSDGDVISNHGNYDLWVVKLSSAGAIQWQKSFGGSQEDDAGGILQTFDGGYIIASTTNSIDGDLKGLRSDTTQSDIWIIRIDSLGEIKWQKIFGGSGADAAATIIPGTEGQYVISGLTDSKDGDVKGFHGGSGFDTWVFQISESGVMGWQKTLGGTNDDEAYSISTSIDHGYVLTGYTYSIDGDVTGRARDTSADLWLVKLSGTGDIQWQKTYGGSSFDQGWSVIQTLDHGYAIAGMTTSDNGDVSGIHQPAYFSDCWVLKLDSIGKVEWQKCYGGSSGDVAYSILQTADSVYVVAGNTSSNDGDVRGFHGISDCWVFALDPSGTLFLQKTFGGSWTDANIGSGIMQTPDKGFLVATVTSSNDGDVIGHHGDSTTSDIWLIKLSPLKNSVTTTFHSDAEPISLFPNPSHGSCVMAYTLDQPTKTRIEVYDQLGQKLQQSFSGFEQQGAAEHRFDLHDLPGGTYFFRIYLAGTSVVKTLEVVK